MVWNCGEPQIALCFQLTDCSIVRRNKVFTQTHLWRFLFLIYGQNIRLNDIFGFWKHPPLLWICQESLLSGVALHDCAVCSAMQLHNVYCNLMQCNCTMCNEIAQCVMLFNAMQLHNVHDQPRVALSQLLSACLTLKAATLCTISCFFVIRGRPI